MELTGENVTKVFYACMASLAQEEDKNICRIYGVLKRPVFDKDKIEQYREDILSMLSQLPDEFKRDKGGGMTFLNMCLDREGRLWTGLHEIVDELVCLGMAVDAVVFTLQDRQLWQVFPEGMPYITVNVE